VARRLAGAEVSQFLDPAGLQAVEVLLIEDDPGDVLMTTEAFELSSLHSTLHVVGDGEQAMRFLRRGGEFTGAPRPDLILLDLNLPRRNGLEVLAELKADPDLLTIPVVIFSTSQAETDIAASYQLHANAYVTKPVSLDLFTEAIRQVDGFFLTLAKLPG
jgi:CheY-like chemotaxis protein